MSFRSHLDPTMFVIFLHINADTEGANFQKHLEDESFENINNILASLSPKLQQTHTHERYHFWQGLRLPFLHLLALLSFRDFMIISRDLSLYSEDWTLWKNVELKGYGHNRLDQPFFSVCSF